MKRKGKTAEATHPEAPTPAGTTVVNDAAVIVFGMSEQGLPQAAWFPAADAEIAVKAASLMKLKAARIDTEEHRGVAKELRQGQVYASERTFAPVVNQDLYARLFKLCGEAPVQDLSLPRPGTFGDVRIGSLVLACDELPDDGWYEAVVIGLQDDLFQLRWRYAARDASFIRSRQQIGLLAPEAAEAA